MSDPNTNPLVPEVERMTEREVRGPLGTELEHPVAQPAAEGMDLDAFWIPDPAAAARRGRPSSLGRDAWRDLRRNPTFLVAAVALVLLLLVVCFPGLFTHTDPNHKDLNHSFDPPSGEHPFGFDLQGQDVYSRVIHGARASVLVGVITTIGTVLLGGTLGAAAGFFGGWVDALISRITDIFFAIPMLLGAIVIMSSVDARDRSLWTVVMSLVILGWPQIARITRGAVLSVKNMDYITAATALGASKWRLMMRHILPNAVAPVIVIATLSLGGYIVTEASLSFLGIGLPGGDVSWGMDLSTAQQSLYQIADNPHILVFPALALSVTVLSFMLLGDAVRDALDPKLR